ATYCSIDGKAVTWQLTAKNFPPFGLQYSVVEVVEERFHVVGQGNTRLVFPDPFECLTGVVDIAFAAGGTKRNGTVCQTLCNQDAFVALCQVKGVGCVQRSIVVRGIANGTLFFFAN